MIAQGHSPARQTFLGAAVAVTGLAIGWGATSISSEAGYAGVGPNFLPWVVALALVCCGIGLIRAARGAFTPKAHFGFEAAAWYWHFVDVVWLFLFASIYIWSSSGVIIPEH